jgi:hypothetical protein
MIIVASNVLEKVVSSIPGRRRVSIIWILLISIYKDGETRKKDDIMDDYSVLAFIDFDDTCIPTTKMFQLSTPIEVQIEQTPPHQVKQFRALDKMISSFISRRLLYTKFVILTSATFTWVKTIVKNCLPLLHRLLFEFEYVSLLTSVNTNKEVTLAEYMKNQYVVPDVMFAMGNLIGDITCLMSYIVHNNVETYVRMVKCQTLPDINQILHQWEHLHLMFEDMIRSSAKKQVYYFSPNLSYLDKSMFEKKMYVETTLITPRRSHSSETCEFSNNDDNSMNSDSSNNDDNSMNSDSSNNDDNSMNSDYSVNMLSTHFTEHGVNSSDDESNQFQFYNPHDIDISCM